MDEDDLLSGELNEHDLRRQLQTMLRFQGEGDRVPRFQGEGIDLGELVLEELSMESGSRTSSITARGLWGTDLKEIMVHFNKGQFEVGDLKGSQAGTGRSAEPGNIGESEVNLILLLM